MVVYERTVPWNLFFSNIVVFWNTILYSTFSSTTVLMNMVWRGLGSQMHSTPTSTPLRWAKYCFGSQFQKIYNQVAPSFIIIEHSVLGHIRKLFDWGEQVGASPQSASFYIFLYLFAQCASAISFNILLCLQTSSALLITTTRVTYLQMAGTNHSLNEHVKSIYGQ